MSVKLPRTCGCLQVEPSQLNGAYGRLLEALFVEATSNSQAAKPGQGQLDAGGQAGGNGGGGASGGPGALDLSQCKLVAAEWQRQASSSKASAQPQTALAAEALAVVRMLGQQEFSGEGYRWLARHPSLWEATCARAAMLKYAEELQIWAAAHCLCMA